MPAIRKLQLEDIPSVYELIYYYAERKEMLPKSRGELENYLGSFRVLTNDEGLIIGTACLDLFTPELAEVKSLAISPEYQGLGYGRRMVEDCEREARAKAVKRIFALTYQIAFFEALNYQIIDIKSLPEKVFKECIICPFKDNCNETALIKSLV